MDHTTSVRPELASIIVPCWNQLEFTRHCIAALVRRTRAPWELIVINHGSTDGTSDYLAGVQDASPVPVTVIANSTNPGVPSGNQPGTEVRTRGISRVAQQRRGGNGWVAGATGRADDRQDGQRERIRRRRRCWARDHHF